MLPPPSQMMHPSLLQAYCSKMRRRRLHHTADIRDINAQPIPQLLHLVGELSTLKLQTCADLWAFIAEVTLLSDLASSPQGAMHRAGLHQLQHDLTFSSCEAHTRFTGEWCSSCWHPRSALSDTAASYCKCQSNKQSENSS